MIRKNKIVNYLIRMNRIRIIFVCLIFQVIFVVHLFALQNKKANTNTKIQTANLKHKIQADKYCNISENDQASEVDHYKNITPFDMAVEDIAPTTYTIKPITRATSTLNITANDIAVESENRPVMDTSIPIPAKENTGAKKESSKDIVSMARHFWNQDSKEVNKSNIEISGTKT